MFEGKEKSEKPRGKIERKESISASREFISNNILNNINNNNNINGGKGVIYFIRNYLLHLKKHLINSSLTSKFIEKSKIFNPFERANEFSLLIGESDYVVFLNSFIPFLQFIMKNSSNPSNTCDLLVLLFLLLFLFI